MNTRTIQVSDTQLNLIAQSINHYQQLLNTLVEDISKQLKEQEKGEVLSE